MNSNETKSTIITTSDSPAQAKIDEFHAIRQQHAAMVNEYTERREILRLLCTPNITPYNRIPLHDVIVHIEADLQQMEHALAAFEWQHGIFNFS